MLINSNQATAANTQGALRAKVGTRNPARSRAPVGAGSFAAAGAIAGAVAAGAASLSTLVGVPVWAMFIGWAAYFTRGHSARDGLFNYLCLALGLLVGFAASAAVGTLSPVLGIFALAVVVFSVGFLVVSLRALPRLGNVSGYFLGVISVFAAHAMPTLKAFAELGGAAAIGSLAAYLASSIQTKMARPA